MGIERTAITELGDDYEEDYRVVIVTEDSRVDIRTDEDGLVFLHTDAEETLYGVDESEGDVVEDRDDPFDL